jgi:hypothetical protein
MKFFLPAFVVLFCVLNVVMAQEGDLKKSMKKAAATVMEKAVQFKQAGEQSVTVSAKAANLRSPSAEFKQAGEQSVTMRAKAPSAPKDEPKPRSPRDVKKEEKGEMGQQEANAQEFNFNFNANQPADDRFDKMSDRFDSMRSGMDRFRDRSSGPRRSDYGFDRRRSSGRGGYRYGRKRYAPGFGGYGQPAFASMSPRQDRICAVYCAGGFLPPPFERKADLRCPPCDEEEEEEEDEDEDELLAENEEEMSDSDMSDSDSDSDEDEENDGFSGGTAFGYRSYGVGGLGGYGGYGGRPGGYGGFRGYGY